MTDAEVDNAINVAIETVELTPDAIRVSKT